MTIVAEPHSIADAITVWNQYIKDNNPEDVWFFVENSATKAAVARQLGAPALDSHITTLQEFANDLVIASKETESVRFLTTEEQLILLQKIVCDSAWNANNTSLSFINELMGRYNFFRKNGISLEEYRGTETKHGILCDIFERYTNLCGTTKLDSIGIIRKALELLKNTNPVKFAVIYNVNPTEYLLQLLRDAVRGYTDAELASAPNITEFRVPEYRVEKPSTLKDIRKYATARDEAESVLDTAASLIESGCDPKDILILTPSLKESAALIRDAVSDFYYQAPSGEYLPLACTSLGTPLASFPVIQCVMAALSAQLTGFRLTDLETITSAKYFVWPDEHEQYISADHLREFSIITNVTERETEWKSAAYRLKDDETYKFDAARIEPLLAWIKQIAATRTQTFAERIDKLKRWLAGSGWSGYHLLPQENKARDFFLQYLNRIAGDATGSVSCTLAEFVAAIRQFVQSKEVPVPARNGIRLEKLRKAGDLRAKHVFIIGLTADNLPNLTTALSPFSIAETQELCRLPDGTQFSLPDRQFEETRRNFAAALLTAEDDLHLSCYGSNGSNSSAPSSFLTKLGEPEPVPSVTVTHAVWYNQIEAGKRIRTAEAGENPLLGIIDTRSLAERIEREQNGYASDFSASPVQELFKKHNGDRPYSPTEIETYLGCPYRWYLDKHLHLRNPQENHAEHTQLGILVHDALEDFFRETPAGDIAEKPFDELYAKLLACVENQFKAERILQSPSWEAKKDWYLDNIPGFEGIFKQFLEKEIVFAKEGWTTEAGMTEYRLADPDPVEIRIGDRTMHIYGSVDRIMSKDGTFRIVDYKTGKSFEDDLKKDRLVQLPVYTEAYRVRNGGVPDPGYYFKLTANECKTVPLEPKKNEDYHDAYKRILESVFAARDRMSAGDCSRAKKCEDKYCPYKAMCRAADIAEGEEDA